MNFGTAFKVFQLQLLKQSGMAVTPQQLGLKSDPVADLQARNATGSFGNVLGGLNLPVLPTPPTDMTDTAAQTKYQADLLKYNNSFQAYNQRLMMMLLNQMQAMQQTMASIQKNSKSTGSGADSGISDTVSSVGGILG
ncbi:hypothetical protein [Vampirovibrio chlorellavorus]|uniref:hypothetical protein n=1 Tax=Vampirovibrio chlorellavorus TaxID=758823 RepID=UPI0026EE1CC9|nr:hypothetical protein [Vampirovibrio chlorellavorus]